MRTHLIMSLDNHIPLFLDLEPEQQFLIESLFGPVEYPSGTIIFNQGDPAAYFYLILSGKVEIHYKPYDGPPMVLTHLSRGDGFGWSAVIGNPYYTSTIIAANDLQALRIHAAQLKQFCREHPATGRIVLERLAEIVSARWKHAHTEVNAILAEAYSMNAVDDKRKGKSKMTAPLHTQEQQLRALIEQLSAYIEQFHGGSVEFVSFDGGTLTVKLGGACVGCPLSPSTLHGWVAGTVHQFFPNIEISSIE